MLKSKGTKISSSDYVYASWKLTWPIDVVVYHPCRLICMCQRLCQESSPCALKPCMWHVQDRGNAYEERSRVVAQHDDHQHATWCASLTANSNLAYHQRACFLRSCVNSLQGNGEKHCCVSLYCWLYSQLCISYEPKSSTAVLIITGAMGNPAARLSQDCHHTSATTTTTTASGTTTLADTCRGDYWNCDVDS